jgi:DinB family protein
MKVLFLAAAMLLAADSTQTLSQEERDKAVAELEGSKKAFLDATKGLSAAQWNFKPAPERWSVAECAKHIALSEGFIYGVITQRIMTAPANPEKKPAAAGKDDKIVAMLQDRSHKATAPEPIDPAKNPPMTGEEAVKRFLENRAITIDYIKTTKDDLRDHLFDHPVPAIGTLDGYQWILLTSGHSRRHTLQILEVKADPNFPKQ